MFDDRRNAESRVIVAKFNLGTRVAVAEEAIGHTCNCGSECKA